MGNETRTATSSGKRRRCYANRSIPPRSTRSPRRPTKLVGRDIPRIDLPAKVMAQGVFLQDMRQPGTLFGRVVRPLGPGAKLVDCDEKVVARCPVSWL